MWVYIAGPMTGLPDNNYPAFHDAAAPLLDLGFTVVNPADGPELPSWRDYIRRGLRQLLTCHAVALLPGWEQSPGARLEQHVAAELGMPYATLQRFAADDDPNNLGCITPASLALAVSLA